MPYHEPMSERMDGRQRIAFFGGSFDPPHLGHIGIACAAQAALHLDTVLFTPVGIQPLKPHGSTAGFDDRVAMTELAIQGLPGFEICLADAPNPNGVPNYTIDTLLQLRKQFPPGSALYVDGRRFAFEPAALAPRSRGSFSGSFDCRLAAGPASGGSGGNFAGRIVDPRDAEEAPGAPDGLLRVFTLRNAAGASTKFYLLPGIEIEISATEVRQQGSAALDRLCEGHELLPDAVCDYIAAHGLYR